MCVCIYRLS
uniref:Uncharacterized protein n=1 Tax=Anguilla anguilla TaxID=7936 RepID=A0A0E9QYP6_ANGAN